MAAGNWLTTAGIGDAYISVAERAILIALDASVKNKAFVGHPVVQAMLAADQGLGPLRGALGSSVSLLTLGTGKLTTTAEGSDVALTNFSVSNSTTITPARKAFARAAADFARSIGEGQLRGEMAPDAYAMMVFEAMAVWGNSVTNDVVALFPSLSDSIGTTGTAFTWGALQDGVLAMKNRGVADGALGVLSLKGAQDLADDGLSLGGAAQWAAQMQQLIPSLQSGAYIGNFMGVDFYLNSELDTSGGDTIGGIITPGCIQTRHQPVALPQEADGLLQTPMFTIEMRRTGGSLTRFDIVSHYGVQIQETARGSQIIYAT